MAVLQNLHTHTTYCDGALPPEAMVKAALGKGADSIGFSEHSFVKLDVQYSMSIDLTPDYIREIGMLKEKYKDKIEIFLGLEMDYHTDWTPDGLDYTIGTLHYIEKNGKLISVDNGAGRQKLIAERYFGGDYYAMAEEYYAVMAGIAEKTNADITGHFDLIAKYNFGGNLFDELHPRYRNAAFGAIEEIMKKCQIFEVNTGAMYRFNKTEPYPSVFLLKEICRRGGEVVLSSDSHDAESLFYMFDEMKELLKTCGFKYTKRLTKEGFTNVPL